MDTSKVNVRIYGTDYVIAGTKSREHILKVAEYVDGKMREIAGEMKAPASSLAVLTAVNAADEFFSREETLNELKRKNFQLEKDTQHYNELWEEAKAGFAQYKDELEKANEEKAKLEEKLAEKDKETEDLKTMARGLEAKLLEAGEAGAANADARVKELESNIFDLEMENVQLKAELERLKK